jgi:beta-glucosidase
MKGWIIALAVCLAGALTGTLVVSIHKQARPHIRVDGGSGAAVAEAAAVTTTACPWLSPSQPIPDRVDALLAVMTPLEEATMLHLLRVGTDGVPYQGFTPAMPQLCVPLITEQDGAAGVAMGMRGVTQLPAPIADAAAFDPALAGSYGGVIGAEDAAKGVDVSLAPTINIDRSPLWGRSYESLGEDPYLTASLAVPLVDGIQSHRVVSVVKHMAVYNQETKRGTLQDDAVVSERALREIYLPAWSAVVQQADPGAVMCSYNLINGTPACQSESLIQSILRGEWGFEGFVRSDCGSVYNQAAAMAAGVSQVKCSPLYNTTTLDTAVRSGQLSKATLDNLARPLLTVLFRFNLIAAPHPLSPEAQVTSPSHDAVALATDNEGAVLLKNTGGLLPLDFDHLSSLALIGPNEGTPMPAGFGAVRVRATYPVTAYAALRARLGSRLRYTDGSDLDDAVALARRSQVAVVVVYDTESEGRDRASLALPGAQDRLVEAVEAANPHTVVVLETGSAVMMPWLARTPALLETWYPGETAGSSLADLLAGDVNPSGKLPVTFPTSAAAMPDNTPATFGGVGGRTLYSDGIDVGYRWYETHAVQPAFPFGFGLSYTKFGFSGLRLAGTAATGISVTATISNTGRVAGTDVVQCYLGAPASTGEPTRQLRGFQRVSLAPGKSATVRLHLTPGDLAQWSTTAKSWVIAPGTYRISVGDGSDRASLPLSATVTVAGAVLGVNSGPAPSAS